MNIVHRYIGLTKKYHVETIGLYGAMVYQTVYARSGDEAKEIIRKVSPDALNIFAFRIQEKNVLKQLTCRHAHSRVLCSRIIEGGRAKMYWCLCLDCSKEYTKIF
jgi:hypothetical protein